MIKNGLKFDCVTCKTSLSQYSVEQHFKTKTHLDNVNGISENKITKNISGYCEICNTGYKNENKHNESAERKENFKERKLTDEKWREKVRELGLDHNMKHYQILITSSNYEHPRFLEALEALYNIHPYIKFNTFDVKRYKKPTDEQLEEKEFTVRLMTRQYNGPCDLDLLNGELETKMQEKEKNQSGWSTQ